MTFLKTPIEYNKLSLMTSATAIKINPSASFKLSDKILDSVAERPVYLQKVLTGKEVALSFSGKVIHG